MLLCTSQTYDMYTLYLFVEVKVVTESDVDYGSDRQQVGEERVVLFRMRQNVLFHYLYLQPIIITSLTSRVSCTQCCDRQQS